MILMHRASIAQAYVCAAVILRLFGMIWLEYILSVGYSPFYIILFSMLDQYMVSGCTVIAYK